MQLKRYQERVIREAKLFLEALATQQASGNRHPSLDAWDEASQNFFIKADYRPRKNGRLGDLFLGLVVAGFAAVGAIVEAVADQPRPFHVLAQTAVFLAGAPFFRQVALRALELFLRHTALGVGV